MRSILRNIQAPFKKRSSKRFSVPPQLEPTPAPAPVSQPETAARKVVSGDASGIPIVDFSGFLDGSAKAETAAAILDSFKRFGFVYLQNFGLQAEKVDEMFDWVSSVPRYYVQDTSG